MSENWYYVDLESNDRVGPVVENELLELFKAVKLNNESFVWRKGFDDWQKIGDVPELQELLNNAEEEDLPPKINIPFERKEINFNEIDHNNRIIHIKVGIDRDGETSEYGPFSLNDLKKLYAEKRVNDKTLYFVAGMDSWKFLAELPIYTTVFSGTPSEEDLVEKRQNIRKPFVARMLFHDSEKIFEGICRDISVGGMQVLMSNYPGDVGDMIDMNVHPENNEHHFVASGKVVRFLDGKQGFSFRFMNLDQQAKVAIESYISKNE